MSGPCSKIGRVCNAIHLSQAPTKISTCHCYFKNFWIYRVNGQSDGVACTPAQTYYSQSQQFFRWLGKWIWREHPNEEYVASKIWRGPLTHCAIFFFGCRMGQKWQCVIYHKIGLGTHGVQYEMNCRQNSVGHPSFILLYSGWQITLILCFSWSWYQINV